MSLFGEYIKERLGKHIIENDKGFATFYYINANSALKPGVYLEDIYIKPEYRLSGEGAKLTDQIVAEAKALGYARLYGTVVPSAKGARVSLWSMLRYGFDIESSTNNLILLVKEI